MKKNRLLIINALLAVFLLAMTSYSGYAQDKKVEKKMIKIKLQTDEDGTVSLDTTIFIEGDFDEDWKNMIIDEDLKKKLEDIDIMLDTDGDGKVMVMRSASKGHNYVYVTTSEDEEGELNMKVKQIKKDIMIEEVGGDSTKTYIIKQVSTEGGDDAMIWNTDGDDDVIVFDKGHKVAITKTLDMDIEVIDGDSVLTYTIKVDDGDTGANKVMVWTTDDKNASDKEVFVHKMKDGKAIIFESKVELSDISEAEQKMLEGAGIKMGKEALKIDAVTVTGVPISGNIKVEFPASGLENLSVSLLNEKGNTIFMEELMAIKGKYIREMELPGKGSGIYFLHISSGKQSLTRKILLE